MPTPNSDAKFNYHNGRCRDFVKSRTFFVLCAIFIFINLLLYHIENIQNIVIYRNQNKSHPPVIEFNEQYVINKQERKILLWTTFFLENNWLKPIKEQFQTCKCDCIVTKNKSEIQTADAVIFHALDLWFWEKLPKYRTPEQVWVLFVAEPPPHRHYTGMTWRFPRYIFNWTFSYRRDSTVYAPYGHFQIKEFPENKVYDYAKSKTKMAVAMISNCVDDARRYREVYDIAKYTKVDFYGRCGNMTCPRGPGTCEQILSSYRFKIAFENSHCKDYVSEKFWNALRNKHIPIVNWKPMQKVPFAPTKSYINVYDFKSMKNLGDYLNFLATNDTEYNSYFLWKNTFKVVNGDTIWYMFLRLCKRLKVNPRKSQVVDYLSWMENDTCKTWSVSRVIERHFDRWLFNRGMR